MKSKIQLKKMNVQNAAINGKGGSRTIHKTNSNPVIKIKLRQWILQFFPNPRVFDVYGGKGLMYRKVWKNAQSYKMSDGEALKFLESQIKITENVFDIDPYSSPYEALKIIGEKATSLRLGIVCTDGCLRRECQWRGNIPLFLQKNCGFDRKNNTLMAAIYYNYPKYLRFIISKLMNKWQLQKLAIEYGHRRNFATVYWAALFCRLGNGDANIV